MLFVGVTGVLTYLPVLGFRTLADDTLWPIPTGKRFVVMFTIGWFVVMALATAGMVMYVVDSLRRRSGTVS